MSHRVILALGTNTGDRKLNLAIANTHLANLLSNMCFSSIYESDAMLLPNSPEEWNTPFYNMVASGESELTPSELLRHTQQIEIDMGRDAKHATWSPRIIDIDILAIDDLVIESPTLHVPHAGTLDRQFFLIPLAELHPDWIYPVKGDSYGLTSKALSKNITENPFNTHIVATYDS